MGNQYLIVGVNPEEYEELNLRRDEIMRAYSKRLNGGLKEKSGLVGITFKYNPERFMVGIWLKREGKDVLAMGSNELSKIEDGLVRSLYQTLEEVLERNRLLEEEWVE